jgi:hypothetical protein
MPLFRKTEICDEEMHAIAAYLAKGPRANRRPSVKRAAENR